MLVVSTPGRACGCARPLGVSRQRVTDTVPTPTSSAGRSPERKHTFQASGWHRRERPLVLTLPPPGRAGARPHSLPLRFAGWRAAGLIVKDEAAFSTLSHQVSTGDGGRGGRTETWAVGVQAMAHAGPGGRACAEPQPGLTVTGAEQRRRGAPSRASAPSAPPPPQPRDPVPPPRPLLLVPDQDARVSPPVASCPCVSRGQHLCGHRTPGASAPCRWHQTQDGAAGGRGCDSPP